MQHVACLTIVVVVECETQSMVVERKSSEESVRDEPRAVKGVHGGLGRLMAESWRIDPG